MLNKFSWLVPRKGIENNLKLRIYLIESQYILLCSASFFKHGDKVDLSGPALCCVVAPNMKSKHPNLT